MGKTGLLSLAVDIGIFLEGMIVVPVPGDRMGPQKHMALSAGISQMMGRLSPLAV
jgi:hypothetical protein